MFWIKRTADDETVNENGVYGVDGGDGEGVPSDGGAGDDGER